MISFLLRDWTSTVIIGWLCSVLIDLNFHLQGNIWTKRVSRDIKGKISVGPVAVNINLLIFANYITLIYLI